jgi:hypothetical protein
MTFDSIAPSTPDQCQIHNHGRSPIAFPLFLLPLNGGVMRRPMRIEPDWG